MAPNTEICSGNEILDKNIRNWMKWNVKGSKSYQDVDDMIKDSKWKELEKIMVDRFAFGTAGLRGRMGPGFGQMNDLVIIQTTQGLAHYLLSETNPTIPVREMGAVIGFDARFNSSRWAKLAAGVFLDLGFKVRLFSTITPTPIVPFTVVQKNACIGIMITASHNPKEDNGYKVFWRNGPQILSPHDKNIQKHILDNLEPYSQETFDDNRIAYSNPNLIDPLEESSTSYFSVLNSILFDKSMNQSCRRKIVYTAMHGVGSDFIDKAFKATGFDPVIHVKEQREPDPTFPTVPFPNPEEGKSALNLSQKTAEENSSIYILANDPDADRLAVAQRLSSGEWKIFNGNEIGTLLGWWQFKIYTEFLAKDIAKKNLYFIASTVSSKMLQSIAREEGVSFEETLTGFKWMGNRAYELEDDNRNEPNKVMLAFEESIGYMCGSQVLDKDGISGAVRAAELIAHLDKSGMTLVDKLHDIYKRYGYHCSRISYFLHGGADVLQKIFDPLRNFNGVSNSYPKSIAQKYFITDVRDLTTGYDSSRDDKRAILPVDPKTQMITFKFSNGIVATLRSSGTEPKLKYYCEYCASKDQSNWKEIENQLDEFVEVMINELLQPEKNGLKKPPGA